MPITYDQIGNPLNDGEWTYTWQNGRQLARMQKDGVDASFVYNEDGLRVQKTVNGVVTNYTLHGKNIVHMAQGNDELHFFYDAQNKPAIVVYNGVPYSCVKNLQGDIIAILDSYGTSVVQYKYDAWGKPFTPTGSMATSLGALNPFRYRCYIYDEETGMYYLRSRYYNPNESKFINADCIVGASRKVFDITLFSYAANNPVMNIDVNGQCCETISTGILYGNEEGSHELGTQTMCVREFIYYLNQMVENHWRYPSENAGYSMMYLANEGIGEVDCVSVYRYIMKWYYNEESYKSLISGSMVYHLYKDGMKSKDELTDPAWLFPGMAVFEYDPNYSKYEYRRWRHVAYYIGYTEEYGHTIIESYSAGEEMRMTTLDTSRYNYYGWLKGIDYCDSDAIECK